MNSDIKIKLVAWQTHGKQLEKIRETVFIEEQQVLPALEWDGNDATAQHILATDHHAEPIGCARLIGDGSIGRMAVLKPWRGKGVGSALLAKAIAICQQQGFRKTMLSAQVQAIPFYEAFGFRICSAPYLDAGILHQDMALENTTGSYNDGCAGA